MMYRETGYLALGGVSADPASLSRSWPARAVAFGVVGVDELADWMN